MFVDQSDETAAPPDPSAPPKYLTCCYHVAECIKCKGFISVPNVKGLCNLHYLGLVGTNPTETPFPFPGMKAKKPADFWKTDRARHWAVPLDKAPPPIIHGRDYVEPKPIGFIRYAKYCATYAWHSKAAALLIQRVFRSNMVLRDGRILKLREERQRQLRLSAILKIQARMRLFIFRTHVRYRRLIHNRQAVNIQRSFRGTVTRRRVIRRFAGLRLLKFFRRLCILKFKDSVVVMMQIRRIFKRRDKFANDIQRVYRGHFSRLLIFKSRVFQFMLNWCARKIQRFYKQEKKRVRVQHWRPPSDEWAMKQCTKKLAVMVTQMYLDYQKRKDLESQLQQSAPEVQRLIRGFLAQRGAKKMKFLRGAFRSWFKSKFAADFMTKMLQSRIGSLDDPTPGTDMMNDL